MVESGQVQPCKTIDMGCGAGNYAIYLASVGFDVTGVDISPSAIALAEANAKQKGVTCRFVAADVLGGLAEITETFDFAYDWSLLHHVFPNDRKQYVETVHRLLVPGGKYLSVCFSEKDTGFGGTGRFRMTSIGTELYFSSEDEDFPSVGDIDFNEHPEEALANPHYVDQTRFSITIDNHRDLLGDAELAELESLLCCSLRQNVHDY